MSFAVFFFQAWHSPLNNDAQNSIGLLRLQSEFDKGLKRHRQSFPARHQDIPNHSIEARLVKLQVGYVFPFYQSLIFATFNAQSLPGCTNKKATWILGHTTTSNEE